MATGSILGRNQTIVLDFQSLIPLKDNVWNLADDGILF